MNDPITTWQAARIIGCIQRHVAKLFHAGLITGQYFGAIRISWLKGSGND